MKILVVHNRYLERGGEDEVVRSEINMLKQLGHRVIFYERSNEEIKQFSLLERIIFLTSDIFWSRKTYREIKEIIRRERPDIAHIHNIFLAVSPSVYDALNEEGIPVVKTLHNYRFICPNGLFFNNGQICEKCMQGNFIPALINRCCRGSFFYTSIIVGILKMYLNSGKLHKKINSYIAISQFSRNKFIKAGFPTDKLFLKPNFVDLPFKAREDFENYAVFIGRLVEYKGIYTLLEAYKQLDGYPLKIIGDGPLFSKLQKMTRGMSHVELLGRLPWEETIRYLRRASFLIYLSECYETFSRTIIESLACGVPTVASDIGAAHEIIQDYLNGLLFKPKDVSDLIDKIKRLYSNKGLLLDMSKNARMAYEEKYSLRRNYDLLMDIYKRTLQNSKIA